MGKLIGGGGRTTLVRSLWEISCWSEGWQKDFVQLPSTKMSRLGFVPFGKLEMIFRLTSVRSFIPAQVEPCNASQPDASASFWWQHDNLQAGASSESQVRLAWEDGKSCLPLQGLSSFCGPFNNERGLGFMMESIIRYRECSHPAVPLKMDEDPHQ